MVYPHQSCGFLWETTTDHARSLSELVFKGHLAPVAQSVDLLFSEEIELPANSRTEGLCPSIPSPTAAAAGPAPSTWKL